MSSTIKITEGQLGHIIGNGLIEEIQKSFRENEVIILETCGVAAAPYIEQIDAISEYAASYVRKNKRNGIDLKFEIPLQYTKPIDIFSELHIVCTVTNDKSVQLGGSAALSKHPTISNTKKIFTYPQYINITAYANGNILEQRTFISTVFHELNHKIDELHHPEGEGTAYKQGDMLQRIRAIAFHDETMEFLLKKIIYRLFSNTEMNALISSVYGDLSAMGSKRQNYKEDIKKTEAYREYYTISRFMDLLNVLPNEAYEILYKNLYGTALFPTRKEKPIGWQKFKQKFIMTVGYRLSGLLKRIGKTAAYYYSMQEHLDKKTK